MKNLIIYFKIVEILYFLLFSMDAYKCFVFDDLWEKLISYMNTHNKTPIGEKWIGLIFLFQIQTIKMSAQNISNFIFQMYCCLSKSQSK